MADRTTIIGLIVAGYGALLATVNSIVQVINYRHDRADIVLTVRHNMETMGPGLSKFSGLTLTIVTAANKGKRPVTIDLIGARVIGSTRHWIFPDANPKLPCHLTEGKSVDAFVDEAGRDFKNIDQYFACDNAGRKFTKRVVPWYRYLYSILRRRFAPVSQPQK